MFSTTNRSYKVKAKILLSIIVLIYTVFIGQVHAEDKRNMDIRHVEKPIDLTVGSKDGTFKAGAVQIPVEGPKVDYRGNTTIVDHDPTSPGVGATFKFNKD